MYVGGHHRWLDNELGCDSYRYPLDTFVVQSPGMGGLSPSTGATAYGHLGPCLLPY